MTFDEADAAYPYDPRANTEYLRGIEKMRGFKEPGMRRNVYDAMTMRRDAPRRAATPSLYRAGGGEVEG